MVGYERLVRLRVMKTVAGALTALGLTIAAVSLAVSTFTTTGLFAALSAGVSVLTFVFAAVWFYALRKLRKLRARP